MAPTSLTALNAVDEAAITTDSPINAAPAWTPRPRSVPVAVLSPADRPPVRVFRATSAMSAPGMITMTVATATNDQNSVGTGGG